MLLSGWVEQPNADGHHAQSLALGRIDLADVGQLLFAGGGRIHAGHRLVIEHLPEAAVPDDAGDAVRISSARQRNRINEPSVILWRLESLNRISVVLRPEAIRPK